MADLPTLDPSMSFDQACAAVVSYLETQIPLGYWAVTRYDGADQVLLEVRDHEFGLHAGDRYPWEQTLCQFAMSGEAPQIAPDASAVPRYAQMDAVKQLPIGAYIGIPITRGDGTLFGSLCGLDPVAHSDLLKDHAPLLNLLCMLLASVLDADAARTDAADRVARAEALADTDPLTGLANRRAFERLLQREEERHRRFADPGCIMILDLDGLKEVNDHAGHAAGDALLCRAADALRHAVRRTDLAARLGGDEFGVIAPGCTVRQSDAFVDRVRRLLTAEAVECSIGVAPYRSPAATTGPWGAADAAMYRDKQRRVERRRAAALTS